MQIRGARRGAESTTKGRRYRRASTRALWPQRPSGRFLGGIVALYRVGEELRPQKARPPSAPLPPKNESKRASHPPRRVPLSDVQDIPRPQVQRRPPGHIGIAPCQDSVVRKGPSSPTHSRAEDERGGPERQSPQHGALGALKGVNFTGHRLDTCAGQPHRMQVRLTLTPGCLLDGFHAIR